MRTDVGHTAIVAYVPVLHEGYRRMFDRHPEADRLYLIDESVTKEYKSLTKDIRALPSSLMKDSIMAWKRFKTVEAVGRDRLKEIASHVDIKIVMPDDEVMRDIHSTIFASARVSFDTAFLRWDKHKSSEGKPVEVDQKISVAEFDKKMILALRIGPL